MKTVLMCLLSGAILMLFYPAQAVTPYIAPCKEKYEQQTQTRGKFESCIEARGSRDQESQKFCSQELDFYMKAILENLKCVGKYQTIR
jgi:hypothetical protein